MDDFDTMVGFFELFLILFALKKKCKMQKEHSGFDFFRYKQVLEYSVVEKCVYNLDLHGGGGKVGKRAVEQHYASVLAALTLQLGSCHSLAGSGQPEPLRALLIAFQAFCECVGDLEMGKILARDGEQTEHEKWVNLIGDIAGCVSIKRPKEKTWLLVFDYEQNSYPTIFSNGIPVIGKFAGRRKTATNLTGGDRNWRQTQSQTQGHLSPPPAHISKETTKGKQQRETQKSKERLLAETNQRLRKPRSQGLQQVVGCGPGQPVEASGSKNHPKICCRPRAVGWAAVSSWWPLEAQSVGSQRMLSLLLLLGPNTRRS
ncbi:hypothetical protein Cgig2_011877 [Carnegiea gigantea]|uniref:Uncharacterized protein n=1 Tax=Carnegiea gigantea TaxID=171969 RepID=A0A9Q1K884_9CARY|nr:hypothetical protein Cgig2_011877 [Carnegiea gigantea]